MSNDTATEVSHHSAEEHHPGDGIYIAVGAFLAILTAIEVSTYYQDFGPLLVPVLLVLMVIKFGFVVLFFMHLRYDAKLFGRLFWAGLVLAVGVYVVTLSAFQFFAA